MVRVRSPKDVLAGLLCCAIAALAIWYARELDYGSLRHMGSGFIPRWLAILLFAMGAFIAVRGCMVDGPRLERISLPLLLPLLAPIALFGLAIDRLGLLVTVVLCVGITAAAGGPYRRIEVVLLATGLATFCALLFVLALKLPIELLPSALRR